MKLIEIKCPNCGAEVHPQKSDITVKCSFCNTVFYVKRESPLSSDAEKLMQLAQTYFEADNNSKAEEAIAKALEFDPENYKVWLFKAKIFLFTGKYYESLRYFEIAYKKALPQDKKSVKEEYISYNSTYSYDPEFLFQIYLHTEKSELQDLDIILQICEDGMYSVEAFGNGDDEKYYEIRDKVFDELEKTVPELLEDANERWINKENEALAKRTEIIESYKPKGSANNFIIILVITVVVLTFVVNIIAGLTLISVGIIVGASVIIAAYFHSLYKSGKVRTYEYEKYGNNIIIKN